MSPDITISHPQEVFNWISTLHAIISYVCCKFDYFVSTFACCLSLCHCALPGRLWLHLLSKHPLSSCRHQSGTPEAFLLYAEQMHLPQPLFAHHVVQAPEQLGEPTLDCLQYVHVCLVLGSPKLDSTLQVQPHKCRTEGNNHFSQLAAITLNCHQRPGPAGPSPFLFTWPLPELVLVCGYVWPRSHPIHTPKFTFCTHH